MGGGPSETAKCAKYKQNTFANKLGLMMIPNKQGIFLPIESTFSAHSLTYVRTPLCAIACINICAHVKDPVVHVRIWWIMEMLKHPACLLGWVA